MTRTHRWNKADDAILTCTYADTALLSLDICTQSWSERLSGLCRNVPRPSCLRIAVSIPGRILLIFPNITVVSCNSQIDAALARIFWKMLNWMNKPMLHAHSIREKRLSLQKLWSIQFMCLNPLLSVASWTRRRRCHESGNNSFFAPNIIMFSYLYKMMLCVF